MPLTTTTPLPPAWKRCPRWLLALVRRCSPRRARASAPAARAEPALTAAADDEQPRGCGWFDSSHDLQQGLRVQEHLNADSLSRELPLGAWLDLQLSGWRAAVPVAAQ